MIEYSIISVGSLGFSYLLYRFLLHKEKSFRFNRIFLLGSLVLCLSAPLLEFEHPANIPVLFKTQLEDFSSETLKPKTVEREPEQSETGKVPVPIQNHDRQYVLSYLYWLVTGFFLWRFGRGLFLVFLRIKKNYLIKTEGMSIISSKSKGDPYSFFHYLFVHCDEVKKGGVQNNVFLHEKAHSVQYHSIDILIVELLKCFLWFNPFLWLYRKAMAENHEFLADEAVLSLGMNIDNYANQLIQAGNNNSLSLFSGFNFSQTKNRIIMMYRKKSSTAKMGLKITSVLCFLALVLILTSFVANPRTSDPFIVVVDPGHGGFDKGAKGILGVSSEKAINLSVAKKLAALSKKGEVQIILTRKKDDFLSLKERVDFSKAHQADLFLSLHCNADNHEQVKGAVAYYSRFEKDKSRDKSSMYSAILIMNYIHQGVLSQGKTGEAGFYVIKNTDTPAIVFEMGYLSNKEEAHKLNTSDFQEKIAENIYESLLMMKEKM